MYTTHTSKTPSSHLNYSLTESNTLNWVFRVRILVIYQSDDNTHPSYIPRTLGSILAGAQSGKQLNLLRGVKGVLKQERAVGGGSADSNCRKQPPLRP